MNKHIRVAVATLTLSAAGYLCIQEDEGNTAVAVIPVVGDVYTVGPGLTKRPDGSPVQKGDTITPAEGRARMVAHVQKDERGLKRCVTAPLTQTEYDIMVDFSYQYGVSTLCKSSMVREANALRYKESCAGYLKYKFVAGYDCSTPGNKRCYGVWTRSQKRYNKCMGEQQ